MKMQFSEEYAGGRTQDGRGRAGRGRGRATESYGRARVAFIINALITLINSIARCGRPTIASPPSPPLPLGARARLYHNCNQRFIHGLPHTWRTPWEMTRRRGIRNSPTRGEYRPPAGWLKLLMISPRFVSVSRPAEPAEMNRPGEK